MVKPRSSQDIGSSLDYDLVWDGAVGSDTSLINENGEMARALVVASNGVVFVRDHEGDVKKLPDMGGPWHWDVQAQELIAAGSVGHTIKVLW